MTDINNNTSTKENFNTIENDEKTFSHSILFLANKYANTQENTSIDEFFQGTKSQKALSFVAGYQQKKF